MRARAEVPAIPANLRINADDFGLTPAISRSILHAVKAGLVNSVSVVPFFDPASRALLDALQREPDVKVGAHLTFIEVPLLTRPRAFPDGKPPASYKPFLRAWLEGKVRPRDVEREWRAQLDLLGERMGKANIHHLDSHQHLHLMPGMWKVARRLQRDYGISVLRSPYEPSLRALRKDLPMGAALQALAWARSSHSSETFFGVGSSMGFRAELYSRFAGEILRHPERRYELMVHPDESERGQRELAELERFISSCAKPA